MHFIKSMYPPVKPAKKGSKKAMESKNLIIAFIWTFVLVSVVALSWEGFGMSFAGYMMFFVIALVATLAVETMIPGAQPARTEVQRELQELKARLDELNGESRLA